MSDHLFYGSAQAVFESTPPFELLGSDQMRWVERTLYYCDRLHPFTAHNQFPRILLSQPDSIEFLAGFMAACLTECPIFLGSPNWSAQEWQRVLEVVKPHQVWGTLPISVQTQDPKLMDAKAKGWIMVPTGGSSGQIKFAIHTWATLTASVRGFQSFFGADTINSCCVLPLYHVSGLMQFLRSLLTNGRLRLLPFAAVLNGIGDAEHRPFLEHTSSLPQDFFVSLVPTQLQRMLQQPQRLLWLRRFHTILLGGAPAWPPLLDQAKQHRLNLAPTYGMTETASQVATLKPQNFLQGCMAVGSVLPHAHVEIVDSDGRPLAAHQTGSLVIQAQSLFQGYYPYYGPEAALKTDDLGYFDEHNHLYIKGRSSRKIISGGENIFPEEVETALYSTGLVQDIYITGLPDPHWGEAVTALYVPQHSGITSQHLKAALESQLSPYKHPKRWFRVTLLPRNAQGKINPAQLQQMMVKGLP